MAKNALTHPTIHLNGTSGDELLAGYETAYRAVHDAIQAVKESAPNARDYYVQGTGAFDAARDEHYARVTAMTATADELLVLAIAVSDQQAARRARGAR